MWGTVIAVLGTLGGAALVTAAQHLLDRRARAERQLVTLTEAVRALLGAVLTYRERYWLLIAALRDGHAETAEDRAARYAARSDVTRARDGLALITPDVDLIAAAEEAVWSALELGDITLSPVEDGRFTQEVEAALEHGRERSRNAHTALRRTATAHIHGR